MTHTKAKWPFQNADGTYDGVRIMATVIGLSIAEIKWTWERLRTLMNGEGKTKDEAVTIVKQEAHSKPWLT